MNFKTSNTRHQLYYNSSKNLSLHPNISYLTFKNRQLPSHKRLFPREREREEKKIRILLLIGFTILFFLSASPISPIQPPMIGISSLHIKFIILSKKQVCEIGINGKLRLKICSLTYGWQLEIIYYESPFQSLFSINIFFNFMIHGTCFKARCPSLWNYLLC